MGSSLGFGKEHIYSLFWGCIYSFFLFHIHFSLYISHTGIHFLSSGSVSVSFSISVSFNATPALSFSLCPALLGSQENKQDRLCCLNAQRGFWSQFRGDLAMTEENDGTQYKAMVAAMLSIVPALQGYLPLYRVQGWGQAMNRYHHTVCNKLHLVCISQDLWWVKTGY